MKKVFVLTVCCALLALVGCKKDGPGTKGAAGEELKVSAKGFSVEVGKNEDFTVDVKRTKLSEDATISFSEVKGVTFDGDKTIKKDADKGKFTAKAAADAPKGKTKLTVTAKAGKFEDKVEVEVEVK